MRSKAAELLGDFADKVVVETLIESLQNQNENEMVKMWVITSLGKIPSPRVYKALISYLEQPVDATMRYMTIRALGEQGDSKAIKHILPYINDDNHHIRHDSQLALKTLGYKSSVEVNTNDK